MLTAATAATLELDTSFGPGGFATPLPPGHAPTTGPYDHLTPTGKADGKFYAIAYGDPAIYPMGYTSFELMRVNADGSPDQTFAADGAYHVHFGSDIEFNVPWMSDGVHFDGDSLNVGALLVQPADGKILLAVQASPQFLPDPWLLIRLNPDGSPDPTFGSGGSGSEVLDYAGLPTVSLRPDGKIDLLELRGAALRMVQLNTNGSPDTSFGTAGESATMLDGYGDGTQSEFSDGYSFSDSWTQTPGTALLPDGSLVAYVSQTTDTTTDRSAVSTCRRCVDLLQVRFDAAGNVVSSASIPGESWFTHGWWDGAPTLSYAVQPDGKALMLDPTTGQLTRFDLSGAPDPSFGVNGSAPAFPAGFAGQAGVISVSDGGDGKILLTLPDQTGTFDGLERFNANGSPDATFAGGQAIFGFGDDQIIQEARAMPDGSILASLADRAPYGCGQDPPPALVQRLAKLKPAAGTPGTFDLQAAIDAASATWGGAGSTWTSTMSAAGPADNSDGGSDGSSDQSVDQGDGLDNTSDDWTTLDNVDGHGDDTLSSNDGDPGMFDDASSVFAGDDAAIS
jgi:uncharacterized delta-60 repeat protein